jgi:hypothetical protein
MEQAEDRQGMGLGQLQGPCNWHRHSSKPGETKSAQDHPKTHIKAKEEKQAMLSRWHRHEKGEERITEIPISGKELWHRKDIVSDPDSLIPDPAF